MAQRVEYKDKYLRGQFWFPLDCLVSLGVMLDHSVSQHVWFWDTFSLELKFPPDYGLIFLNNLQTQLSFHTLKLILCQMLTSGNMSSLFLAG